MNVHVIISTHNGANWIEKCITSLLNSNLKVKIDVIDNVSSDDTVEIIKKKFPDVDLIVNETDMGFGKANNVFLRKALADNADYVFLLNQDAWVENDTIEGLINVQQNNPQYGIVSPIHLNGAGSAFDYKFSLSCSEKFCPGLCSDIYLNAVREIYDINFVNGALWLISKECLKSVGLFDPIFPLYFEDLDYVNRLKNKGLKIGLAPGYRGYHDREYRPAALNNKRNRIMRSLKYIYILKDNKEVFYKAVFRYIKFYIRRIFKFLFQRRWNSFFYECKIGALNLFSLNKVLKTRRICAKPGAYIVIPNS